MVTMKFLFITKPFKIEPLGILYLSAVIKEQGYDVSLALTSDNLEERFRKDKPDFVGYNIMTGDQDFYDKINRELKKHFDFFSIAGGPHPTFFPEMFEKSSFDAICLGEGEETIKDILRNPEKKIYGIKDLIENLDKIPFPDRKLISEYPSPIKHFIASRGCCYDCSYCFNRAYAKLYKEKGPRVRFRSVDNLLDEIEKVIRDSPTRFVYFQDDTFILDKKWVKEFSIKYKQRIKLPFHCHTRANLVTEEIVGYLKDAGCYSVHIAAESGNEEIRRNVLNRNMTNEQILNAMKLFRSAGIKTMLQNILGLPFSSLKNDLETLELNIKCQPDYSWVSIFQPYPKTELGERCVKTLLYTGDFSDLNNNFFDYSVLNIKNKNEIAVLQKLFAIAVKNPDLYYSGILESMLKLPYGENKEILTEIYKNFRNKSDEVLYGFKL